MALQKKKARLQMALNAARMGTFDWDIVNDRIRSSGWHDALHGFEPGEFDGSRASISNRVHADDVACIEQELNRCAAAGEPFLCEFRTVWPDGSIHWLASRGEFTYNENKQPVRMHGVVQDVTQRRKAEATLHHHQAILEETGRIAQVGGWEFDVVTGKGTWTDEVARIHDMEPDEDPSMEMGLNFYSDKSRGRIEAAVAGAIDTGTPYDLELEIETVKGNRKWVRTIGNPVVERGKVVKVRGSFQDITGRKESEQTLERTRADLERAQSIGHMGSWEYTVSDGRVKWSDELYRIFGLEPRSVDITSDGILEMIHPEDRAPHNACLERMLAAKPGEEIGVFEFRIPRAEGRTAYVQAEMEVHYDSQGAPECLFGTVQDITERKEAEFGLQKSEKRLRDLINGLGPSMFLALLNPDGTILEVSRPVLETANLRIEDVRGRPMDETEPWVYSPDVRQKAREAIDRAAAGKGSRFDVPLRAGEKFILLDFSIEPVWDEGGKLSFWSRPRMTLPIGNRRRMP